jgi:hypothetical protein
LVDVARVRSVFPVRVVEAELSAVVMSILARFAVVEAISALPLPPPVRIVLSAAVVSPVPPFTTESEEEAVREPLEKKPTPLKEPTRSWPPMYSLVLVALPKRTVPRVVDALVRLLMVLEAEVSHWSVEVPKERKEFARIPVKVLVAPVTVSCPPTFKLVEVALVRVELGAINCESTPRTVVVALVEVALVKSAEGATSWLV